MARHKPVAAPVETLAPLNGPTTWMERFRAGLSLMCGGAAPPLDMCQEWFDGVEVNGSWRLQDWAATNAPHWAQGIVTLDAAAVWANTPVEGEDHLDRGE